MKTNLIDVPEIQLSFKQTNNFKFSPIIKQSEDIEKIFRQIWDTGTIELLESFKAVYLNQALKPIGFCNISIGGISSCIADVRLIMGIALKSAATSLAIAHNHPSGVLQPSKIDENLTKKVKQASELFDIRLLDHIILTAEGYFSFADNGLL